MPAEPPVAFATICTKQPGYILSITPASSGALVLRHPEPQLSVCDNQTLERIATLSGHRQPVTDVVCGDEGVWSSSLDASVIRWDQRSGQEAMKINAFLRKPLPLTCLAVAESDHLVMAGTELQSSEAHILFYDVRNPSEPAYIHSSTHSDDMTSLHLLPPTATFARAQPGQKPLPDRLLLSTSTDGCVAISNMRETDEQEALLAEENWGMSIAASGSYDFRGGMRLWARSDQDSVATWKLEYNAAEEQLELNEQVDFGSDEFKFKKFRLPKSGPNVTRAIGEEKPWPETIESRYIIDVCPSLGVGQTGAPMLGVGTNEGNIVLEHCAKPPTYAPSAYFVSGPAARGHKDVVRSMTHVRSDEVIYTGSEDGILAGWSLAGLPPLVRGDPDVDDDGGDGRDESDSDSDSDTSMDTDDELEISDRSDSDDARRRSSASASVEPRHREDNPVLRGRDRKGDIKDRRKGKRHAPY